MLDTNMNLLATLGGVVPPAPGLGPSSGISQPRFDVLLLEVAKAATEGQKAKQAGTVPQEVKQALLDLLVTVAESGPEDAVRVANSPPDQEALVSQMVQKHNLQGDEEGLLLSLFQTALQRIADGPPEAPATQGNKAQRGIPGLDPGPQGGTPGEPASLRSPVLEGQVRQASLDAVDKPQTRIVEVAASASKQGGTVSAVPAQAPGAIQAPEGGPAPLVNAGGQPQPQAPAPVSNPLPPAPQGPKAETPAPPPAGTPRAPQPVSLQTVPNAPIVSPRTLDPSDPAVRGGQTETPSGVSRPSAPAASNPPAPPVAAPQTGDQRQEAARDFANFLNQSQPKVTAAPPAQAAPQAPASVPATAPQAPANVPGNPAPVLAGSQARGTAGPPATITIQGPSPEAVPGPPAALPQVRQSPEQGNASSPTQGRAGAQAPVPQDAAAPPFSGTLNADPQASPAPRAETPALPAQRPQVVVTGPQPQPVVVPSSIASVGPSAPPPAAQPEAAAPPAPATAPAAPSPAQENGTTLPVPPAASQNAGAPAAPSVAGNAGSVRSSNDGPNRPSSTPERPSAPLQASDRRAEFSQAGAAQVLPKGGEIHISAQSIGDLAESVVKDYQLRESVLRQVSTHLANLEKGASQLIIQLEPKQLGKLQIELFSQEGRLSAKIVASNADVRDVIAANLQSFQDSLAAKGIQVQQLSVAIRADVHGGNPQPFQNQAWMFKTRTSGQETSNGSEQGDFDLPPFISPGLSRLSFLA